MNRSPQHRSFLLTAWEESSQNIELGVEWRFGLEEVQDGGRRRVFSTLEDMMLVLAKEILSNDASSDVADGD